MLLLHYAGKLHKQFSNFVSSGFSVPELATLSSETCWRKWLDVAIVLFLLTTPSARSHPDPTTSR